MNSRTDKPYLKRFCGLSRSLLCWPCKARGPEAGARSLVALLDEAWGRGDVERVDALLQGHLAEEAQFDPLYLDRVYRGYDGTRQMWADLNETWEEYRSEPEEIVDLAQLIRRPSSFARSPAGL